MPSDKLNFLPISEASKVYPELKIEEIRELVSEKKIDAYILPKAGDPQKLRQEELDTLIYSKSLTLTQDGRIITNPIERSVLLSLIGAKKIPFDDLRVTIKELKLSLPPKPFLISPDKLQFIVCDGMYYHMNEKQWAMLKMLADDYDINGNGISQKTFDNSREGLGESESFTPSVIFKKNRNGAPFRDKFIDQNSDKNYALMPGFPIEIQRFQDMTRPTR